MFTPPVPSAMSGRRTICWSSLSRWAHQVLTSSVALIPSLSWLRVTDEHYVAIMTRLWRRQWPLWPLWIMTLSLPLPLFVTSRVPFVARGMCHNTPCECIDIGMCSGCVGCDPSVCIFTFTIVKRRLSLSHDLVLRGCGRILWWAESRLTSRVIRTHHHYGEYNTHSEHSQRNLSERKIGKRSEGSSTILDLLKST